MPVPARRLVSGTIVVEHDPVAVVDGRTVAYGRVSLQTSETISGAKPVA